MTDVELLRPIIVNAADSNYTVDLNTTNILLLTIPNYSNRALYDTIKIYFDNQLYYTYIVDSFVSNMVIGIGKDQIRKQDYNINYTIKDLSDNINVSDDRVFHFKNIDERFKIGEPLFPDARENVIDVMTVETAGGLRVITDYKYIEAGHKIRFYWRAVYKGTDTVIDGTEYISSELTVNPTDVQNGYKGIIIPVYHIAPAKDIGVGQCYYTVDDSFMLGVSQTANITIVDVNWNDGKLHTYCTTGIARKNPNYPYLYPYNFVTVVGEPGRRALIETSSGAWIDEDNGVDEHYFTFDHSGRKMFRLFYNEKIPPFGPGSTDPEAEVLHYGVAYESAQFDLISQDISFNNYFSHDGPIRAYSYNSQAYIDNETPIQVLIILNRTVISNRLNVTVDKNAKINHFSNTEEIYYNSDYTASFFVYNDVIEENNIVVNIDNSAYPLRLTVKFIDPVKAKK